MARRKSFSIWRRSSRSARMSERNNSILSAPARLARYMAISASSSRPALPSSSPSKIAIPIDPVITISWPPILIGARTARRMRSASRAKSAGSFSASIRMANWSPPTRASVSRAVTCRCRRRAIVSSRLSPTGNPNEALIDLNLSMSMIMIAGRNVSSVRARVMTTPRRSRNSARLANPVRLQWTASWTSRS